jgi:hypothetical protein
MWLGIRLLQINTSKITCEAWSRFYDHCTNNYSEDTVQDDWIVFRKLKLFTETRQWLQDTCSAVFMAPGLPDFSWYMIPKPEKCTKGGQNVPNSHRISPMSLK